MAKLRLTGCGFRYEEHYLWHGCTNQCVERMMMKIMLFIFARNTHFIYTDTVYYPIVINNAIPVIWIATDH